MGYLNVGGRWCSVVRHLPMVVQLGPQPHAWSSCPRRSLSRVERSPRRGSGPPTGPTRDPVKVGRPRTSATDGLPRRDAGRPSASRPPFFLWQPATNWLTPTTVSSSRTRPTQNYTELKTPPTNEPSDSAHQHDDERPPKNSRPQNSSPPNSPLRMVSVIISTSLSGEGPW